MSAFPEQQLAKRAARAHGLITRPEALACGLSPDQVRHRVRTGRWVTLHPGVYVIAGTPATWHQAVLAALKAAGPRAVASYQTALFLLGVERLGKPETIHLTVPVLKGPQPAGSAVHRTRRLDPTDCTERERVPVTTGERTLIDLAAVEDRTTLIALTDDTIGARETSRKRLYSRAVRLRPGRPAVRTLINVTTDGAEGEFRSWLERELARVLHAAGLPPPVWNLRIRDARGLIGMIDAVYAEPKIAIEVDGLRFHSTPDQRRRDDARMRRLVLADWLPLRFTWLDVMKQPAMVTSEVGVALQARTRVRV